ncbi:MAG: TrbI/VirB10 family protein [Bdellovibrionota bacterium]
MIPKNSIVFGTAKYSGKGQKVFLQLSKLLLPDGKEVKLIAQALNSYDYSPGIEGEFHGKATERIVSTLGLSMVSAMTETLTEREVLGKGEVTEARPKATMKNALYQGVSKASEMEAQRQASEMNQDPEFVTIPAGQELIINLLETYYGP